MKIEIFGKLTDIISPTFSPEFPVSNKGLQELLIINYPDLKGLDFKVAVNHQIINDENYILKEEDQVALLPPFSGG